ncbi:hypothetical protein GUITHDRAFT_139856 [Guillardia theta CCMP2712]|uniref:dAMP1 SANT/Myb-like domain-containing protein n=1 Tax=Guillardia theta (strain CCMP2712) TaxID=905079 RepID=L1J705_GUITC|nr:hypothetical protein GUITHDRAFT_139856 [Guillardia theta CCMP2712]EKX44313.1 hypothetical protein GUITHDRAFT_139856 [Guillardia theta CCMP2712]|eukprot:XP_005831293.1 hypothetical protein GUITHDRAFT_139856 [Guillardia theta CCMP2712]
MDAVDILGAAPRSEFKPRTRPPAKDDGVKALKGLSREVYQLTGVSPVPHQVPSHPVPSFGKKRSAILKKVQWEFQSFTNSARTDGLELKHWQKKGVKWDEYPFAKFNKKVQLLLYSDEEYETLLHVDDWTRQQSDELMKLAERFHLNFILVQDRWEGDITIEILKDRFYFIQRKLTEARNIAVSEGEENVLITKPYNRHHEEQRKKLFEESLSRSANEEKLEQETLDKARKIENMMRKKKQSQKGKIVSDTFEQIVSPPPGGVLLRSNMILPKTQVNQKYSETLKGIGFDLPTASHRYTKNSVPASKGKGKRFNDSPAGSDGEVRLKKSRKG